MVVLKEISSHLQIFHPGLGKSRKRVPRTCYWCSERRDPHDPAEYEDHLHRHHRLPGIICYLCRGEIPGMISAKKHYDQDCPKLAASPPPVPASTRGRGRTGRRRPPRPSPTLSRSPILTRARSRLQRAAPSRRRLPAGDHSQAPPPSPEQ